MMRLCPKGDRGRKGLSPSPPSEPCVQFSRTRLSSRWFPHRDWLASPRAMTMVNSSRAAKKISFVSLDAVTSAANMRSLHPEALTHIQSCPWAFAPCLALTGTVGAWLSLCPSVAFTLPPSYPSFPRSGFAFRPSRGFHRSGTMGTLTPTPLTYGAGLPAYCATPSCRSVSNHVGLPDHRLPPRQRDQRVSDFALNEQARRSTPAESSSFSYGPTVRLRLLSTPLRADAVTFGYGAVAYSDTDFHRADVAPSRAHIGVGNGFRRSRPPNRACGSPAHGSPVGGFLIGIGSPTSRL